jgi:hypothetical protein
MALRFARVKGYRHDKRPEDADTIDTVRAIFEGSPRADHLTGPDAAPQGRNHSSSRSTHNAPSA